MPVFITLEGTEGVGKSTALTYIQGYLAQHQVPFVTTREPGGTPLAEKIRTLLLTKDAEPMSSTAELLLVFAARAQHLAQVIQPALASGQWVLCDRFTDATYAYQGGGRELGAERVAVLEQWMGAGQPDRTWLFDVPLEVARARLADAREPDRFEREGAAFFERTRQAYHARAKADPGRIHIVDSTQSIAQVRAALEAGLRALLAVSA